MNNQRIALITSRIVIMLSSLGIVWMNTYFLGLEGQGEAGLISFGILIVATVSMFITGGNIVYFAPRMQPGETIRVALIWNTLSALLVGLVLLAIPIFPKAFIMHIIVLGWLQGIFTYHMQLLLARMRMIAYAVTLIVQSSSSFMVLFYFYHFVPRPDIGHFETALYTSFCLTTVLSGFLVKNEYANAALPSWKSTFTALWNYGKWSQTGNIFHLFNQRINLSLLNNLLFQGKASAGLFSIAMYGAEVIWMVAKSISTEQYALIANSENADHQIDMTRKNLRLAVIIGLIASVGILLVPETIYLLIVHSDADALALKETLMWLIPGILANSAAIILAHYFSGVGKPEHNAIASAAGFALGLPIAVLLIPTDGITGAAVATSLAFLTQTGYFLFHWNNVVSANRKDRLRRAHDQP